MIKLSISHCYRKFLEKSRSFLARLSTGKGIALSLLAISLRGRFMKLSMSSSYQRFAARQSARKARLSAGVKSLIMRPIIGTRLFLAHLSVCKARITAGIKSLPVRLYAGAKSLIMRPIARARSRPHFYRRKPLPKRQPGGKRLRQRSYLGKRIDAFLLIATLMVLVFVTSGYLRRTIMDAPAPVSIFVSPQYWAIFGDVADIFIREFQEQNPGFRVVLAEQENLDIVFFDDGDFAALVESSALASLSPYIYTETDEDQWALPLVAFVDLFFYNIDLLRDAGNDRPPGTRAEFLATARSVAEAVATRQEEIFPFAMGLGEADPLGIRRDFYPWVWATGAAAHSGFAADGTLMITGSAATTIDFLAQMHRDGLIEPGTFETTGRERLEQFAEGRIAMMMASARDILFVRNSVHGVNFDVTAVPAVAVGRNRLGISGIYAGISSASERPNEAWGFLVFIAARSHLLASALGAVPGSFFINFPSRYIEEDPMYAKAWELFEAADIVEFSSGDIAEKEAGLVIREMLAWAFGAE